MYELTLCRDDIRVVCEMLGLRTVVPEGFRAVPIGLLPFPFDSSGFLIRPWNALGGVLTRGLDMERAHIAMHCWRLLLCVLE